VLSNFAENEKLISLVVPVYNEEESLGLFFDEITQVMEKTECDWEIICIDDGSIDATYEKLQEFKKSNGKIKILSFSRNFGKEIALTAGIDYTSGDAVIPIDVDLQDPPELILEMIKKWQEGFDVVLATRKTRGSDGFFKKFTAGVFYKIIGKYSNVEIPANTGDFRLMDKKVVDVVKQLPEKTRFMKGIFAWVGFKSTQIYFDRPERAQGETSWSIGRLFGLAFDGIFSFTTIPLRIWLYIGVIISLISFSYAGFIIFQTVIMGIDVPGYASLMTVVLFMGGVQLLSLGVIGEYIARIYRETKQRPLYILDKQDGFEDKRAE